MNLREYAEHRTRNGSPCTKQAIERHIPKLERAGAAVQNGRYWDIDAAAADAVLAGVDPNRGKPLTGNTGGRPSGASHHQQSSGRPAAQSARMEGARAEMGGESNRYVKSAAMLLDGRAAKAYIDAEDAKLDLQRKQGSLLERSQVKQAWESAISQVKTSLLIIPDQLCDYLATETDPVACREMVYSQIWEALDGLTRPLQT